MKYKLKLLYFTFILILPNLSFPQNLYIINADYGKYLYHEDNSISLTRDQDFKICKGISIGKHINFSTYKFLIEIGYNYSEAKNIYSEEYIDGDLNVNLFQTSIPISVTLILSEDYLIDYGIGISIINNIRTIQAYYPVSNFKDQLYSIGLGVNGLVYKDFSLNKQETIFIRPAISIKSNVGIYYDKSGRNLNDYNQLYFTINFTLGVLFSI